MRLWEAWRIRTSDFDTMAEQLTWKEIQQKYPNRWVGLVNVKYHNDDGISVESATVKYTDKSKGDLTRMA